VVRLLAVHPGQAAAHAGAWRRRGCGCALCGARAWALVVCACLRCELQGSAVRLSESVQNLIISQGACSFSTPFARPAGRARARSASAVCRCGGAAGAGARPSGHRTYCRDYCGAGKPGRAPVCRAPAVVCGTRWRQQPSQRSRVCACVLLHSARAVPRCLSLCWCCGGGCAHVWSPDQLSRLLWGR